MPTTIFPQVDTGRAEPIAHFLAGADNRRHLDLLALAPSKYQYRQFRHGVHVVAATTSDLTPAQTQALIEFRIAQYVRIGFIDIAGLVELLQAGAPIGTSGPDDLHIVAMTETGQILCTAVLRGLTGVADTVRMSDLDRPKFPVEQVHGPGVFDRLRVLPDLPVARVRELGGFVRTQGGAEPPPELSVRGPVEVGVAVFRAAAGPLALGLDAMIGDLEPTVAKRNLDYFGAEAVLLPGTVPVPPPDSYLGPRYVGREVHPFALLTSDLVTALDRLREIERALDLPGTDALLELLRLRDSQALRNWSTLWPPRELGSPPGYRAVAA